jgi:glycosyltransferase involved in cell wall biosynthesis
MTPNKLNILYVPPWIPNEKHPLRGIFFKEQFKILSGYLNKLIVLEIETHPLIEWKNLFKKNSLNVEYIDGYKVYRQKIYRVLPKRIPYRDFLLEKNILKVFNKILQEENKIDIIHALSTWPAGYYCSLIKKNHNTIPFFITEHSSYLPKLLKLSYFQKRIIYTINWAQKIFPISNAVYERLAKENIKTDAILPNFIDTTKFKFKQRRYNDTFKFVSITKNHKIKGVDILLEALRIVIKENKFTNVKLDIIGGDFSNSPYLNYVEEHGLESFCNFTGFVNPNKLSDYLLKSNCLIISSRSETFSMAGIEALASGIPVVTTACGGPETYITENKTGIIVRNQDPKSLANGMIRMINEYSNYDHNQIRQFVENNYDEKVIIPKILEKYQEIL